MSPIIPPDIQPAFASDLADSDIRAKLIELLGLAAVPDNVDFTTSETRETEDIRVTHLSYQNSLRETVPAILMEPPGHTEKLRPGIVCISGTSGSAERVAHPHFHQSPDGPLIGWGRELARRGFTTLAISIKGTEGRRRSIEEWATECKLLSPYGRSQMGILVEETLRAARILCATNGVDKSRIGLTGMSLGGNATWYSMACAPWIAAGVTICGGLGSLASVIHQSDNERHSAYYYIPNFLCHFDHPRVVATCMPPRPFMMISPTRDEDMPRQGVDALIPVVQKAYAATGHDDRFKVYQPEGNHRFLVEYFEQMVAWFDHFLLSPKKERS